MKFRILLRSFDNELINLASQTITFCFITTDCKVNGVVALPTKIKRFCVLRSPHVDKDSREHFEVRLYKRFIDINDKFSINFRFIIKNRITIRCFLFIKNFTNKKLKKLEKLKSYLNV